MTCLPAGMTPTTGFYSPKIPSLTPSSSLWPALHCSSSRLHRHKYISLKNRRVIGLSVELPQSLDPKPQGTSFAPPLQFQHQQDYCALSPTWVEFHCSGEVCTSPFPFSRRLHRLRYCHTNQNNGTLSTRHHILVYYFKGRLWLYGKPVCI